MKVKAKQQFIPLKNERIKGSNIIEEGAVFNVPEGRGLKLIELGICERAFNAPKVKTVDPIRRKK